MPAESGSPFGVKVLRTRELRKVLAGAERDLARDDMAPEARALTERQRAAMAAEIELRETPGPQLRSTRSSLDRRLEDDTLGDGLREEIVRQRNAVAAELARRTAAGHGGR